MLRRLLSLALALCLLATAPLYADDSPATLVANSLRIEGDSRLIAEGSVEVFFRGSQLTASRLIYDQRQDMLRIDGPITLRDTGSDSVILASQAELKADMSEGILRSARVVLNQQLQLAAAEVARLGGGRYSTMSQVVASSCKVCAGSPTPLWEIRARRVVHDREEQQLYFEHATLRFGGVPVFLIPRLRMPDPNLHRATGFLRPTLQSSSTLGAGLRWPYFITLGRSRDLTVSPFITTKGAKTLELRYRQAFRNGTISLTGMASRDDLRPGETRGLLRAEGQFDLRDGFILRFNAETVSDRGYLLDYALDDKDRLDSRIEVFRTRRNEHISGRVISIQTLRAGESSDTLAASLADLTWQRRFSLGPLGGQGGFALQAHSHYRHSTLGVDTPADSDLIADGRDVTRGRLHIDWRRDWILRNGMVFGVLGEANSDIYRIGDDVVYGGNHGRSHAAVATELRWPLVKAGRNGVNHLVEPVVQLVWAGTQSSPLPNEDSVLVEFDQGNLFSLNRFPGADAVERGTHANLGVNYLRQDPNGWTLGATLGRVIKVRDLNQFTAGSGLANRKSDWLLAWQLGTQSGLGLTNRLLLDDAFSLTKAEMLLNYDRPRLGLKTGLLYHKADPAEGRLIATKELVFDGQVALGQAGWSARLMNRYDFQADRASNAGLGLSFRNECLAVDLSLSRRFTSSTSVAPTTDFSVSLELLGFGGSAAAGASRRCRG